MTSHNRMALSSDPDATVFESGLHVIVETPARCPSMVCKREPELASQILIVASAATILVPNNCQRNPDAVDSMNISQRILTAAGDPHPIRGKLHGRDTFFVTPDNEPLLVTYPGLGVQGLRHSTSTKVGSCVARRGRAASALVDLEISIVSVLRHVMVSIVLRLCKPSDTGNAAVWSGGRGREAGLGTKVAIR